MTVTPHTPVIIRPAAPGDIGRLHALELACSQNPWTLEGLSSELSNPNAVFPVLELTDARRPLIPPKSLEPSGSLELRPSPDSKRIIGFICSTAVLDELQILEVAVHPDYRNRGFGTVILRHLISLAVKIGVSRIFLDVRASNYPAIRLYEKVGFVRDGVRKGYYQDGEDAVLMSAGDRRFKDI